jgi:hypothetical protein
MRSRVINLIMGGIDSRYIGFGFRICQDLDLSGFGSLRIWIKWIRISQGSDLSGFGSLRIRISCFVIAYSRILPLLS